MIKTSIKPGQRYYDEPIYALPRNHSILSASISEAFGIDAVNPPRIMTGYRRIKLRWLKPGQLIEK